MNKIPLRITSSGNVVQAKTLVGFAKKQVRKLEERMKFQNLKTDHSFIRLSDGSTITCVANYGLTEIHIYVPEEELEDEQEPYECKCGEYFSEGVITAVSPIEGYLDSAQLYTVDVCQKGNTQISVENCVSHDFSNFTIGERIQCCLSIREIIACVPYCNYYDAIIQEYLSYQVAWGEMGNRQGYTIKNKGIITSPEDYTCWNNSYVPPVDVGAQGPCGSPINVPVEDWTGFPVKMCSLLPDITNCFWLMKDSYADYNHCVKDITSLYSEYAMLKSIGSEPAEIPINPKFLFNLHILKL